MLSNTGFPVHVKTLQYLQDNTMNVVGALAKAYDNYTILWGMNVNAGQVSEGAFIYNGEIIPFLASAVGNNVTINEVVENANYNTNPNNNTSFENLPAYSYKSAQVGTGGIHQFEFSRLRRYVNERVIAQGVVDNADIHFGNIPGAGAIVNVTFPTVTGAYRIEYTLRTQGITSGIYTHQHMIIDSTPSSFRIAIQGAKLENREYFIEWKILKV